MDDVIELMLSDELRRLHCADWPCFQRNLISSLVCCNAPDDILRVFWLGTEDDCVFMPLANRRSYNLLRAICAEGEVTAVLRQFESTQDGRAAFLKLYEMCNTDRGVNLANQVVENSVDVQRNLQCTATLNCVSVQPLLSTPAITCRNPQVELQRPTTAEILATSTSISSCSTTFIENTDTDAVTFSTSFRELSSSVHPDTISSALSFSPSTESMINDKIDDETNHSDDYVLVSYTFSDVSTNVICTKQNLPKNNFYDNVTFSPVRRILTSVDNINFIDYGVFTTLEVRKYSFFWLKSGYNDRRLRQFYSDYIFQYTCYQFAPD